MGSRRLTLVLTVVAGLIALGACGVERAGGTTSAAAPQVAQAPPPAPQVMPLQAVAGAPVGQPETGLAAQEPGPYRIGLGDVLQVSVVNDTTLDTTQIVRPDGMIAIPLVGEIRAAGVTPEEVRRRIAEGLEVYFREPGVTVIVTEFRNRRVSVVGEVRSPGVFELRGGMHLLEALALAGGITPDAYMSGAAVIRDGRVLAVNLEHLVRRSDLSQNIALRPNDAVVVPNASARKVLVLGEVETPTVITLKDEMRVLEAIAVASGFSEDAEKGNVLIVRGGLARPVLYKIDTREIFERGNIAHNVALEAGDIVYVSKSRFASVVDLFDDLRVILQPIVMTESALILLPDVWEFLTTGSTEQSQSIVVGR